MSLLSLCQDAADEIGIFRPDAIAGSSDPNAQKLLRYANKIGNRLMQVYAWQDLRKEKTFSSAAAITQTSGTWKPTDFNRFVPETLWDRTNNYLISGPVIAKEWQTMRAATSPGSRKFAYRGGDLHVFPIMDAGQQIAFEYVSGYWAQSSASVAQAQFSADTDTPIIDEELICYGVKYEFLTDEGLPNAAAAAAYEERFELLIDNDQPDAGVMVSGDIFGIGRHFDGVPGQSSNAIAGNDAGATWGTGDDIWGG